MFNKFKYYSWADKHKKWDNVVYLETEIQKVARFDQTAILSQKALCFPHPHLEKMKKIYEIYGGEFQQHTEKFMLITKEMFQFLPL